MPMRVQELARACESIAPLSLAEEWDNVGLIVGDPEAVLRGPVMLTIDLTPAVMDEAERIKAGAVLAYHPPIFTAIKRLVATDPRQATLLRAIRLGMAVYSPHTALDAAPGAMTDWLSDMALEAGKPRSADRRALIPRALPRSMEECKIVTFVPASHVDQVRGALASSGAGNIGNYSVCSFASAGEGSFLGNEKSKPIIGAPGHLEKTAEYRLEMVLPRRAVPLALEALKRFHPYEEPACDVYALEPKPDRRTGAGRRLVLDHPATIHEIAARLKSALKITHVQIAPALGHESAKLERLGVVPGAGASLVDAAAAEGCQVFITGEMKHHEVIAANARGVSIILAGHSNTERGYLVHLAERLRPMLAPVDVVTSKADRTLMQTV